LLPVREVLGVEALPEVEAEIRVGLGFQDASLARHWYLYRKNRWLCQQLLLASMTFLGLEEWSLHRHREHLLVVLSRPRLLLPLIGRVGPLERRLVLAEQVGVFLFMIAHVDSFGLDVFLFRQELMQWSNAVVALHLLFEALGLHELVEGLLYRGVVSLRHLLQVWLTLVLRIVEAEDASGRLRLYLVRVLARLGRRVV
jgi:hypothetical protein